MNITNPYGPNTTILLPGPCNASCDFCFWDREMAKIKPPELYLDLVESKLLRLPVEFKTLSLSGGEPTISPYFGKILTLIGRTRRVKDFDRVVLTTHGGNIMPYITAIGCVVDHINISRHSIGDAANTKIFGTKKIPTDAELLTIIAKIHDETPCDVTLNCVINPDVSVGFCYDFIGYAKFLGADAVSFRKVASDASPTQAELFFKNTFGVIGETNCPVCRGVTQMVSGFDVRWKGSVNEPSVQTGGVYELIIHPDGNVYADWGMKIPVNLPPFFPVMKQITGNTRGYDYGRGCGGRGCGGNDV